MTRMDTRQERSFGWIVGGILAVLAGLQGWHGRHLVAAEMAALSAILVGAAWVRPASLRGANAFWTLLGRGLGWINSRVLLSVLFVAVCTPIGWVLRAAGWDPLRRAGRRGEHGWQAYPERLHRTTHYERLY